MAMDFHAIKPYLEQSLPIVSIILVVGLAYQSAQLTLSTINTLPMGDKVSANMRAQSQKDTLPDIQQMLSWHIFGEAGQVAAIEATPNVEAPETKLDLELQGVSVGKNQESSSAIISESKGSSGEFYWVGDSVFGKAILSAVYDDKVVLKQNERLETLRFNDDFASSGLMMNASSNLPSANSQNTNSSDMLRSYKTRKQDQDGSVRELGMALNDVGKGQFTAFDSVLDGYGADLEKNLESAARTAGLEQTSDGMKVGSRAQEEWMNQVGLKQGDIVKSVNNYPVSSLKSDRSAIDSVIKSCVARIEVQRGANTFVVTYPFCR